MQEQYSYLYVSDPHQEYLEYLEHQRLEQEKKDDDCIIIIEPPEPE